VEMAGPTCMSLDQMVAGTLWMTSTSGDLSGTVRRAFGTRPRK